MEGKDESNEEESPRTPVGHRPLSFFSSKMQSPISQMQLPVPLAKEYYSHKIWDPDQTEEAQTPGFGGNQLYSKKQINKKQRECMYIENVFGMSSELGSAIVGKLQDEQQSLSSEPFYIPSPTEHKVQNIGEHSHPHMITNYRSMQRVTPTRIEENIRSPIRKPKGKRWVPEGLHETQPISTQRGKIFLCDIREEEKRVKEENIVDDENLGYYYTISHDIPRTPKPIEIKEDVTCPKCMKSFARHSNLKLHLLKHDGHKPYECKWPGCGKHFAEKGNLKTHMRIHSGERPYRCSFVACEQSFTTQGHLKDHARRHTGESCCSSRFMRSSTLKIHMRIHSGEKPYKCTHCDKSFSESGNLKTHMRIHTGERPFSCPFEGCERKFKTKSHVYDHIRAKVHQEQINKLREDLQLDEHCSDKHLMKMIYSFQSTTHTQVKDKSDILGLEEVKLEETDKSKGKANN